MTDFFRFSGGATIQEESHCGIINGRLTVGIPYKGLARVDGLWAPPYLATNFQLTLLMADKEPPTADWAWWPFKVRRTAVVEGVRITTDTVLAPGRRAGIVSVALENTGAETRDVPLRCDVRGAPEYSIGWGFRPPASRATAAPAVVGPTLALRRNDMAIVLWNYGETWEIMPLYDPAADREHIRQYLREDMTKHLAFDPMSGKGLGPHYPVNQEKVVGLIYYYVKNTGDEAFLKEEVAGRTVLEHAIAHAGFGDDLAKPVALLDYGPRNDHLELRRGYPYHHTMPDLNGRRYANYLMAARLAEVAGKPAPELRRRAEDLKALFKREMWDAEKRWFAFITPKGRDIRWTNQMFKLFGSGVLDAETEAGLLGHLNDKEFLSEFGLHSLAKGDVAYDPRDVDNGGPGSCTSFPPQIAERLYKAGRTDAAEDLLRRTLWWADVLPYWPDSMVADRKDYRHDTPLQCMVDGVAAAQCVIFGLFGIAPQFDGSIVVCPHPPKFAPAMALRGVRLRGTTFDVAVDGDGFEVRCGGTGLRAEAGQAVLLKGTTPSLLGAAPARQF
jgi:hypothetical protein